MGIIALGGGYYKSDILFYLSWLGIDATDFQITDVSVDAALNQPGLNDSYDTECALDIQIIAGICPKSHIYVYFAPNTESGFYNAIYQAGIIDQRDAISISWGASESEWINILVVNTLFEAISENQITTVCAASGDFGSSDGGIGDNVDFPGSSPFVLCCGGTTLNANESDEILSEVVWNNNSETSATGGGLSEIFDTPQYQLDNVGNYDLQGKRGLPDVAAHANPQNGYIIYIQHLGGFVMVGGTSAVSPLMSAFVLRCNEILQQQSLQNVGFLQPIIYTATTTAFNDILVGNNGTYTAVREYDLCSGNGSPIGVKILNLYLTLPISLFTISTIDYPHFQFNDESLGQPTSWLWNFDDDTTSTLQNPTHVFYMSKATYHVTLEVANEHGSSISSQDIERADTTTNSWQILLIVGITFVLYVIVFVVLWMLYKKGRVQT